MARGRKKTVKFIPSKDREPYERQPKESDKAWKAFMIYRDMGPERTLRKVAEIRQKETGINASIDSVNWNVERWSSRWGWRMRVEEWERELDNHRRRVTLREIEKMHERHIQLSKTIQGLGALELNKLWNLVRKDGLSGQMMISVADIIKLLESGVKLERNSRGQPDAITEERHQISVDESREAMRELLGDSDALKSVDDIMEKLHGVGYTKSTD